MLFGTSTPPEPMGDYTGFLLNWVGARSREQFATAMDEIGLRPQQFAAMVVIATNPGMAQQDLVEATNIDPSTMVAMLDALEQDGLAERRPHPTDRRKRALHLTAKGKRKLDDARTAAQRVGQETFGVLEAAEFRELHRLLRKLAGFESP
jgi:DNA-binding MarR family transcriptional regulator